MLPKHQKRNHKFTVLCQYLSDYQPQELGLQLWTDTRCWLFIVDICSWAAITWSIPTAQSLQSIHCLVKLHLDINLTLIPIKFTDMALTDVSFPSRPVVIFSSGCFRHLTHQVNSRLYVQPVHCMTLFALPLLLTERIA